MLDSLDTLIGFALVYAVVSLLVTILVQMTDSLFNLRGQNLRWAVAEVIESLVPALEARKGGRAWLLADALLRDPLISGSQLGWHVGLAKAVRAEELFGLIGRVAAGQRPRVPEDVQKDALAVLRGLGVTEDVLLLRGEEAIAKWRGISEQVIKAWRGRLGELFEAGAERSHEWFLTHTRLVTFGMGFVAAFGLQLDLFDIYKQVSSDKALREELVAQAGVVLRQGEKILSEGPSVAEAAWAKATNGIAWANVSFDRAETIRRAEERIRKATASLGDGKGDQLIEEFRKAHTTVSKERMETLMEMRRGMASALEPTRFELFPTAWPRWKRLGFGEGWMMGLRHCVGMLGSTLLLGLGAPFWFNMLRSLASLRPAVARSIAREAEEVRGATGPDSRAR